MSANSISATILLVVLRNICALGQSRKDLYILYTKGSKGATISTVTDSTEFKVYKFTFNIGKQSSIPLKIDNNGMLQKWIKINGKPLPSAALTYSSFSGKNLPKIVRSMDVVNILRINELNEEVLPEDYYEIIKHFDSIYVISEDEMIGYYYIARKVRVGELYDFK